MGWEGLPCERGYAIRTLREELPTLFYKEMSYDIFR